MLIIIQNAKIEEKIENKDIVYLNKICNLKKIKENVELIFLNDITIDNNGIIKDYDFFLEEVLITKPIKIIIANFSNPKLEEICKHYKVELITL